MSCAVTPRMWLYALVPALLLVVLSCGLTAYAHPSSRSTTPRSRTCGPAILPMNVVSDDSALLAA